MTKISGGVKPDIFKNYLAPCAPTMSTTTRWPHPYLSVLHNVCCALRPNPRAESVLEREGGSLSLLNKLLSIGAGYQRNGRKKKRNGRKKNETEKKKTKWEKKNEMGENKTTK